ncbi:MAG: GntR family transcriptional regulator [Ignavibacteriae bacterium]|nr:GntR family transcriptional regulator [Ignavibacteriota bacterium]
MKIDLNDPTPFYEQIENIIRYEIKTGVLKEGDQIGSHNELAGKYSVSLITIKKALSNLIKDGALISRIGKGTFVSSGEKKLDLSKHQSIGLVLRDLNHPFFSPIVKSVEKKVSDLGYNLLLASTSGDIEKEENQITHFKRIGVSGLIIASMSLDYNASDYIKKLQITNFPYIMISYMHDPDYWYVGIEQELGGYLATRHLINLGYKKIGCVHGGKGNVLGEIRKNGYSRALSEKNIPYNSKYIYYLDQQKSRFESGNDFGKIFTQIDDKPEALFFYTDSSALGFQQAVMEKGLKIPDDVAIVGFNDIELAKYAAVPLTTIKQDASKIGKLAAEIVISRIEGKEQPNRTILKPELIIRESCGAKKLVLKMKVK